MVSLLISLLVICAVLGILYWVFTQLSLPPPIRMVVAVIFAIVAIILLLRFIPGGAGISLG